MGEPERCSDQVTKLRAGRLAQLLQDAHSGTGPIQPSIQWILGTPFLGGKAAVA